MKMKRTIPALPVESIDQSMKFYTNKMGFHVRHNDSGFAIVCRDDIEIHLWAASDETWKTKGATLVVAPICSGAESFIAGTASCRIEIQGIDELYEEYKLQQIIYDADAVVETRPWGVREFPILDHENNLITFFERI